MRTRTFVLMFVLAACGRSGMDLGGDADGGSRLPVPQIPPGTYPTPVPTGTASIVEWVRIVGGADEDVAYAVDEAAGKVGIAGSFRATATFAPATTSLSAGGDDGFVAVFNTAGTFAWHRPMGGTSGDIARAIAMRRADGAVVTGGRFESATIDFGNGTRNSGGNGDQFTAAYAANSNPLWDVTASITSRDEVYAVAWGTWVLLVGDQEDAGGDTDGFVFRRNEGDGSSIGTILHDQGGADDWLRAVAFNGASDRYVGVGYFQGTGSYESGGSPPTYTSQNDDAVAWHCLVGSNCITWSLRIGGGGDERATAVASAPGGDWLIAGEHSDVAIAGATTLPNGGGRQAFVARVGATGTVSWAITAGGGGDEAVTGVGVDASGRIYVTGTYDGAFDPGGALPLLPSVGGGSFLLVLSPSGVPLSAHAIGGNGVDVHALAVHPAGAVYLAGAFSGTTDFGIGPVSSASGSRDAFLLRLRVP